MIPRLGRSAGALLHRPEVAWGLAALFALAGIIDVSLDRHLHDEGQLTQLFARMTWEQPVDLLFWQKSRPPISALYAPFAAIGPRAFGVAHVVVAALAIPMLAQIARAFDHRWPNLAALLLAASPLYFACAAAGVSNSDGVAVAIVGAWLWFARGRPFAGAVVLGMVPWIRAELAPLPVALLLAAPAADRRAAWSGIVVFPLVYASVGALVHGDVLWWAHYPPALPEPMADHPLWARQDARVTLGVLSATLLAATPAWVLAIPVGQGTEARAASRLQWAWLLFAAFEIGVLLAMPRWRAFNFDLSPRYLLGVVPALALAISWRIGALSDPAPTRVRTLEALVLVGAAAIGFHLAIGGAHPTALAAAAATATIVAVGRAGFATAAAVGAVALALAGPLGFADGTGLLRTRSAPALEEIHTRLGDDPKLRDRPLYTNAPLLSSVLDRGRWGPVHYIVQADQLHEIVALTNPMSGQRQRVLDALSRGFYGIPVFADAFTPDALPADAVLVLVDDPRLDLVMPPEIWEPALRLHTASANMRIMELRSPEAPR